MTKVFSVKSNATRAMKKQYPNGGATVEPCDGGWYIQTGAGFAPEQQTQAPEHTHETPKADAHAVDADLHTVFKTAYAFFNERLFGGKLPECMLLVHRKKNARGYFWAEQWKNRTSGEGRHEIAMNPDNFGKRTTKDILSTLVHEMTHLEQQAFGKPPKGAYHDKEWVKLMNAVGLVPYASDREAPVFPEGFDAAKDEWPVASKNTGTKVTHVVAPGGAFCKACDELLATGLDIAWTTGERSAAASALAKKKRDSKTKYTCPECELNAWAKPDAAIGCWECGVEMEVAG